MLSFQNSPTQNMSGSLWTSRTWLTNPAQKFSSMCFVANSSQQRLSPSVEKAKQTNLDGVEAESVGFGLLDDPLAPGVHIGTDSGVGVIACGCSGQQRGERARGPKNIQSANIN